ncbi:MAG: hypothetical protein PHI56_00495 [Victivallaceae bacterium]|nr:hypothetical protein [Victivallaceae bacterium]
MKIFRKNIFAAVLVPLAAALLARTIMFFQWYDSPLRYYWGVQGLDMQTNLMLGEMFYNGNLTFSPHRLIVALVMLFNSGINNPDAVVIIQIILGIPTGALVGMMILQLTGKRWWAMLSGITAALYSPILMHECFHGKDALSVDFAVLSLFLLFLACRKRYALSYAVLATCSLILQIFNHLSGLTFGMLGIILLCSGLKWNLRKITISVVAPILGLLVLASVINGLSVGNYMPFNAPMAYIGKVTLQEDIGSSLNINDSESEKTIRILPLTASYLKKWTMIFSPYEIPNNINYYFIKNRLKLFNFLPGPLLLVPLSVISMIMIVISAKWRRRFALPLFFIAAYSLPLMAFYPLARYRIILCPALCMLFPYLIYATIKYYYHNKRAWGMPVLAAGIYGSILFPGYDDELLRATDFVAFGKAQELKYGDKKAAEESYRAAVSYNPSYLPGIINWTEALILNGKSSEAMPILYNYYLKYPEHKGISYHYALSLMGGGRFIDAEKIFGSTTPPENSLMQTLHNFYHGECLRLLGNPAEAMKKYHEALKTADPERTAIIKKTMDATSQSQSS